MRLRTIFLFFVALFHINQIIIASSPSRFAKHFSDDTGFYSARELSDGGYLLAGSRDLIPIIVRLDGIGEVQWVKKFDPGPSLNGYFLSAIETADGGFLAVGEVFLIGGSNTDPVIVKLNNAGKILWQRRIAGAFDDHLPFVIQTSDGGYLAVGVTGSFSVAGGADCFAIKLNQSGNLLWAKALGRGGFDNFFGALETEGGDYILAGSVDVFGTTEPVKGLVLRVDRKGKVRWQALYRVTEPAYFELASITKGPKNTFYMGGLYTPDLLQLVPRALLMKLNSSSKILWKKTYHRSDNDTFYSVASTSDGGVIAAGESAGKFRGFQTKIQTDGHVNWTRKTLGPITFQEQALSGGFLAISETYIWPFFHMVIRSDSSGKTDCGLLKQSPVEIGQARIAKQAGNVTIGDVAIQLTSPGLIVRHTSVRVQDPCASSIQNESACLATKQH